MEVGNGWNDEVFGMKTTEVQQQKPSEKWEAKEDDPASCLGFGNFSGGKLLNCGREFVHSDESTLMIGFPSTRARETGVSA